MFSGRAALDAIQADKAMVKVVGRSEISEKTALISAHVRDVIMSALNMEAAYRKQHL